MTSRPRARRERELIKGINGEQISIYTTRTGNLLLRLSLLLDATSTLANILIM